MFSDSEKKVSQGWGADEGDAELKAEDGGAIDAAAEALSPTANDGWGAEGGATSQDAAAAEATSPEEEKTGDREGRRGRDREPEEEDNTLTLDEYLKQQREKELELVPKLETRKANEGDDSIWKDAVVVNKKDEEEPAYFVGKVSYLDRSRFMSPHVRLCSSQSLQPHQRLVPRRRRKCSSRLMLVSSDLPAVVVVVVVATVVATVATAAVVVVVVEEEGAEPTAMEMLLPLSMLTTRMLSPPSLNAFHSSNWPSRSVTKLQYPRFIFGCPMPQAHSLWFKYPHYDLANCINICTSQPLRCMCPAFPVSVSILCCGLWYTDNVPTYMKSMI